MALALSVTSPAFAQDDQAVEALIAESSSPQAAIASAREQIGAGDTTGAAATLERALLERPNDHEVRLLYAAALCRLGDVRGARIEASKLDRQDFSAAGWNEVDQACSGQVPRPLASAQGDGTGVSGEIYAGVAYDRDAAGALVLQFDFFGGSTRDDGLAAIAGARLNWRSPGYGDGVGIYAGASLASKHDIAGPRQDYDIGELRFGIGSSRGHTAFAVGPVVRHLRLFNDPYVTEFGGQAEVLLGASRPNRIRLRAEGVQQNYGNGFPGDDGDGIRLDLSAAWEAAIANRGFVTLGVGGEFKDADLDFLGYRGARVFAGLYRPFDRGRYINLAGTLRYIDFRDDGSLDRKDWRGFARAAVGVPLGGAGLFAEGGVSYTFRNVDTSGSFLSFRNYSSPGADARLIWKF